MATGPLGGCELVRPIGWCDVPEGRLWSMNRFPLFSDAEWQQPREPVDVRWSRYVGHCQAVFDRAVSDLGASRGAVAHFMAELLVERLFGEEWAVSNLSRLLQNLRDRNDLRAVMFEAEVVWLLKFVPLVSNLRIPTGVKGDDYDAGVMLDGGAEWAIEAKAKDDVPFIEGALRNPLKKAAQQIPAGGLGTIFLRVPRTWNNDLEFERAWERVVDEVLRSNSRIHAAVLVADEWKTSSSQRFQTPSLQVRIRRSKTVDERIARLLAIYEQAWKVPPNMFSPVWSGVI